MNEEFYLEIKHIIIEWIENNYDKFINFFWDDEENNLTKEELAKKEFNYIKTNNSWGSDYTIAISCLLFDINIAIYIYDGDKLYKPYFIYESGDKNNQKNDNDLMILSFHNNNHFDLIYSKNDNTTNICLYNQISNIKIKDKININKLETDKLKFTNHYVECDFKASKKLYDEICNFLFSILEKEKEINQLQIQHPKWHYIQILSMCDLKYPERLKNKDKETLEKRKTFRKNIENYIIDKNNRLCVLNPLKKFNETKIYYRIPYSHEKDVIINEYHSKFNHSGRDATYNNIIGKKWYWYGMIKDIQIFINKCPNCTNVNKFKKLKGKKKIIL